MPTILRIGGFRFFFFSLEGREPPHVHVEQAERYAKVWLEPVSIARAKGFRSHELTTIVDIVGRNRRFLEDKWHEYFGSQA
jgi:hypothetical protein